MTFTTLSTVMLLQLSADLTLIYLVRKDFFSLTYPFVDKCLTSSAINPFLIFCAHILSGIMFFFFKLVLYTLYMQKGSE